MFSISHPTLQIVHTKDSHWIVATTNELCTKVFVYDTLYSDVTHDTKRLITEMFGMSQVEVAHGLQKHTAKLPRQNRLGRFCIFP